MNFEDMGCICSCGRKATHIYNDNKGDLCDKCFDGYMDALYDEHMLMEYEYEKETQNRTSPLVIQMNLTNK